MSENATWSLNRPSTPGPYWIWSSVTLRGLPPTPGLPLEVTPVLLTRDRGPERGQAVLGEDISWGGTYGEGKVYWHPWQPEAPLPPEIDPGPGVWTDRPFERGLHRVRVLQIGRYADSPTRLQEIDLWVEPNARPWVCWEARCPVPGLSNVTCSDFGQKAHWYRYPEPSADPGILEVSP